MCPPIEKYRVGFPAVWVLSSLKLIEAEGSAYPLMRGTDLLEIKKGRGGDEKE